MTNKEVERRRRIRLSVAAYAYEVHDDSVMSDGEFDKECLLVDISQTTGNRKLDNFFKNYMISINTKVQDFEELQDLLRNSKNLHSN